MKINTVGGAFDYFIREKVNLAKTRTDKARGSRDAIIDKINNLSDFLPLDKSKHLHFGSFARRTKIRPINDIDIMICLSINGSIEYSGSSIKIKVTDTTNSCVKDCCDVSGYYFYTYYLNSTKVKNKFKSSLYLLHDCRKADLHSNQEAVTLQFSSYEWNFDIVPCIYIADLISPYYLIPDGKGNWKKTAPRRDRDKVSKENTRLNGQVLELIRLAKYWAKANHILFNASYLIETMVINYCSRQSKLYDYIDWNFECILDYFQTYIFYSVSDMKGIQGNINTLSTEQRKKFSEVAKTDYSNAVLARKAETEEKDANKAIKYWGAIFRNEFPSYGDEV